MAGKFTRRIAKELKNLNDLQNNSEKAGIDFIYEPTEINMNIFKILIPISNFYNPEENAEQTTSYNNLKKANVEHIVFEVNLEDNYPIKAPFIRIVKPIIKARYIFPNGNMCMDIFGSKNWSAAITLINVFTMIIDYLKKPDIYIKVVDINREYDMIKAKQNHKTVINHIHKEWNH